MAFPPVELLKSTHTFPTQFVFKVIGDAEGGFLARVLATTREAAGLLEDPVFTVRQSTGGKHVAVTLEVPTESAEQVLVIYGRLAEVEGLSLLL